MFCTTSETKGEVNAVKHVKFITDRSMAVVLLWFMLPVFGFSVSVTFHPTCVYIIFSSIWVSQWPTSGK